MHALERFALPLILAALAPALVYKAWTGGVTADEPSHVLSAHVYAKGGQTLEPRDMPPLIRMFGAWAANAYPPPVPADLGKPGDSRFEWNEAVAMMDRIREPLARSLFFWARVSLILFPLGTVVLAWLWSRELFGPRIAIAAAALLAFEPTFRAHGSLYKNDHAATFAFMALCWSAWRYWRAPSARWALATGAALGLALLTKMSMLVMIAPAAVLLLAGALRMRWGFVVVAASLAAAYAMVLAAAGHEAGRLEGPRLAAWSDPALPGWASSAAGVFTVLPGPLPMIDGVRSLLLNEAAGTPVYLAGEARQQGSPWYFLVALAVKLPEPMLVLAVIGLAANLRNRPLLFLLVPAAGYVALASMSGLQLGVRLVLPAFPAIAMLAAAGVAFLWSWKLEWLGAGLLALFAAESALSFPHDLAFFNRMSGGTDRGLRWLADSNLDWGQGLPELSEWMRRNKPGVVRLSYFGTDSPWRYFREDEVEIIPPPWGDDLTGGRTRIEPEPGVYAIGATLLPGHFFAEKYRGYYAAFAERTPIARPAGAIYIYRVP